VTNQQAHDQRAQVIVAKLKLQKATPAMVHHTVYAKDPGELHFAPHLVTAVREGGLWPELQRHTI
jgi:hypothetical protein